MKFYLITFTECTFTLDKCGNYPAGNHTCEGPGGCVCEAGYVRDLFNGSCIDVGACPDHHCDIGFLYNYTDTHCNDINECETDPCDASALCNNTVGSYFCRCDVGLEFEEPNRMVKYLAFF